jgi:UDPglucose 6-dehydrogenase
LSKIVIVGLGYVGLTTGLGLAKIGHKIVGVDNNQNRVSTINSGELPIFEPGLEFELLNSQSNGNFVASTSLEEASKEATFFFVCVPTPQDAYGSADLSYVYTAVSEIAQHAEMGATIVIKSTVPVGTGEQAASLAGRDDIAFASNPEFLREGSALKDFLNPDRILVGSQSPEVAKLVLSLYENIDAPKIITSTKSSELIKYAANSYLASRLSFVNDLAALCEKVGADIDDVVSGMGSDSRIGRGFLQPGPGWGGSCFPKDTRALIAVAQSRGIQMGMVSAAIGSNESSFQRVVDKVKEALGGDLNLKKIAVWGLAFKANTDDTRDSPALEVIGKLLKDGAEVVAYDPIAQAPVWDGLVQATTAISCVNGSDALIVMTEWDEFKDVNPAHVAGAMRNLFVFDTRRILEPSVWGSSFELFSVLGNSN